MQLVFQQGSVFIDLIPQTKFYKDFLAVVIFMEDAAPGYMSASFFQINFASTCTELD